MKTYYQEKFKNIYYSLQIFETKCDNKVPKKEALSGMNNNKSPGLESPPMELYKYAPKLVRVFDANIKQMLHALTPGLGFVIYSSCPFFMPKK